MSGEVLQVGPRGDEHDVRTSDARLCCQPSHSVGENARRIGVAAGEMPRLFERFHRIETARSRSNEGSGIGLALVKELVELHGGSITAEK